MNCPAGMKTVAIQFMEEAARRREIMAQPIHDALASIHPQKAKRNRRLSVPFSVVRRYASRRCAPLSSPCLFRGTPSARLDIFAFANYIRFFSVISQKRIRYTSLTVGFDMIFACMILAFAFLAKGEECKSISSCQWNFIPLATYRARSAYRSPSGEYRRFVPCGHKAKLVRTQCRTGGCIFR